MITDLDLIFRCLLITVISALIGLERQRMHHAAGVRTHILVGLGSTLIMIVSIFVFDHFGSGVDPGRLAGQVLTGIGFLGAGTIIRDRAGVHGLTTAATIWIVSAIGLAIGIGYYISALVVACIALITLYLIGKFEHRSTDKPE